MRGAKVIFLDDYRKGRNVVIPWGGEVVEGHLAGSFSFDQDPEKLWDYFDRNLKLVECYMERVDLTPRKPRRPRNNSKKK